MRQRGDEEGEAHRNGAGEVGAARRAVHVPTEEVVHGDVPLAGELEPVQRVPPVGVELAVGEAGDFRKGAEGVLEDDKEDEQEGDHEGEEEARDGLGEDEGFVEPVGCFLQAEVGLVEDGDDELFARDDHEKDAAEDGEDFVEELEVVAAAIPWVFEFVAERWAQEVVEEVVHRQVGGIGDVA